MTEKQVPEIKSDSQQIQELADKLAGHEVFARLRGQFTERQLRLLEWVVQQSASPSDFARRWAQLCKDLGVIGSLLARQKRDQKYAASKSLFKALTDKAYMLPGEDVCRVGEDSWEVTVMLYDLPKALPILWWFRAGYSARMLDPSFDPSVGGCVAKLAKWYTQAFQDLLGAYPSARQLLAIVGQTEQGTWIKRPGASIGPDLLEIYEREVYDTFVHPSCHGGPQLILADSSFCDHYEFTEEQARKAPFGHVICADQAWCLAQFTRQEQKRISSWYVKLPRGLNYGRLIFGFFPEHDREYWDRKPNAFVAKGFSQGYGMVALNKDEYHPYDFSRRYIAGPPNGTVWLGYGDALPTFLPFVLKAPQ